MKTNIKSLTHSVFFFAAIVAGLSLVVARHSAQSAPQKLPQGVTRVAVVFEGGHETLEVDRGRPVVLIAAALNVPAAVFREAFSHVRPASPGSGGPTEAEARRNKDALMKALRKYGVTNERLDTVSNFYRYPPGRGNLWRNMPATANALVKNGAVIGYELIDGGAGYSSPPTVSVPDIKGTKSEVKLFFSQDLDVNGAVSSLTISQPTEKRPG